MIPPAFPKNEAERLAVVSKYKLLDYLPEEDFDNITSLIAAICEVPIALITVLDKEKNHFKSNFGIDFKDSPREFSFCGHAILQDEPIFIVKDVQKDARFKDNPVVKENNVAFYAGVPLIVSSGHALGTLCIYDHKPRELTQIQKESLVRLAKEVINLFELRLKNEQFKNAQAELRERNEHLKKFAGVVSHDLKSPLANITSLSRLIRDENRDSLSEESHTYFDLIEESSETLKEYINGILNFYKADELLEARRDDISYHDFFENIKEIYMLKDSQLMYPKQGTFRSIKIAPLTQIMLNLIDNAFKYNRSHQPVVKIQVEEEALQYRFTVTDNAIGIDKEKQPEVFDLFKTTGVKDRQGKEGTGIGLATVKSLVTKLGGEIGLSSEIGKGSSFRFTIKK